MKQQKRASERLSACAPQPRAALAFCNPATRPKSRGTGAENVMMPERDHIVLPELGEVIIRELRRPEDEAAYLRFGAEMAADDLRMRFAVPTRWSIALAQRMLMLNGIVFAAFGEDGEILGVGRLTENEVALAVRSKLKRRGLGRVLLEHIVHSALEQGIAELTGTVLAENRPMLALARVAGFRITGSEGPVVSVRLCLP